MPEYRVGTIYHPGKTHWQDGTDFNYRAGALELRMFFSRLSGSDIRAIKNGACTFAFSVIDDIVFFMFEFGRACPWSDNSYSIHLVDEAERTTPPELKPGEMALLTIILVSSEDGIIRALRQLSLGHDFSRALYDAIRAQSARPFDRATHDAHIARAYRQYPNVQALLARAQATCIVESHSQN
jgi:hypothetical protein